MCRRYKCGLVILVAVALALSACVSPIPPVGKSGLELLDGAPVVYKCEKGDRIVARYYSLSDESLHFAKVTMPDGKQYTLPNVVSGSGARYTDEFKVVWWTKGDSAFSQARDQNGKWQIKYKNCKEISGTK